MSKNAMVLLSGGQDSTVCLYWAKKQFTNVIALCIDYGQRHRVEIESSKTIARFANVTHKVFSLSFLKDIGDSSLVASGDIASKHRSSEALPSSFVPGRNILFIVCAAIQSYKLDISNIVVGACQTDFSGYPDCRDDFVKALQVALSLGLGRGITIHTPLMWLTKKESIELALTLPGCMEALAFSHTCYEGQNPPCGKCPSCVLRKKGFDEAGIIDPILKG